MVGHFGEWNIYAKERALELQPKERDFGNLGYEVKALLVIVTHAFNNSLQRTDV